MYVCLQISRKIAIPTKGIVEFDICGINNIVSNFDYQNRLRTKDFAGDCNLINLYNLRIKKC